MRETKKIEKKETLCMVVAMQMAHLEECWWYKGGQVSLGQSKARLSEKLISKEAEEVARNSSQEETKTDNRNVQKLTVNF